MENIRYTPRRLADVLGTTVKQVMETIGRRERYSPDDLVRARQKLRRVPAPTPLDSLPLAPDRVIARVMRGTPVATLGFPAATTDASAPHARLATDVIGEVRDGRYLSIAAARPCGIRARADGRAAVDRQYLHRLRSFSRVGIVLVRPHPVAGDGRSVLS